MQQRVVCLVVGGLRVLGSRSIREVMVMFAAIFNQCI